MEGFACCQGRTSSICPCQRLFLGTLPQFKEYMHTPELKKGDVVFFSEATVHGALPWRASHERRLALYRFAPFNFAYGRGYLDQWDGALALCTPRERAVLESPYATRLERPLATAEGDRDGVSEPPVKKRAAAKKVHDEQVFGTTFFLKIEKKLFLELIYYSCHSKLHVFGSAGHGPRCSPRLTVEVILVAR